MGRGGGQFIFIVFDNYSRSINEVVRICFHLGVCAKDSAIFCEVTIDQFEQTLQKVYVRKYVVQTSK